MPLPWRRFRYWRTSGFAFRRTEGTSVAHDRRVALAHVLRDALARERTIMNQRTIIILALSLIVRGYCSVLRQAACGAGECGSVDECGSFYECHSVVQFTQLRVVRLGSELGERA